MNGLFPESPEVIFILSVRAQNELAIPQNTNKAKKTVR